MVDERDFQLLANLLKEPLASNEELGRRVRLSGTAVKTRLAGLTEEGVFGGLYGIPAPEVFQRRRHVYVFRGDRVN
ncbi:MAG: winged helix-turn-helix transcriptional regulator, partial [Methanobacteriota archaeon]